MNPPVPEVTVLIHKITKDRRAGRYRLHIKKVLGFKYWARPGLHRTHSMFMPALSRSLRNRAKP
jgi:hypothetical protein